MAQADYSLFDYTRCPAKSALYAIDGVRCYQLRASLVGMTSAVCRACPFFEDYSDGLFSEFLQFYCFRNVAPKERHLLEQIDGQLAASALFYFIGQVTQSDYFPEESSAHDEQNQPVALRHSAKLVARGGPFWHDIPGIVGYLKPDEIVELKDFLQAQGVGQKSFDLFSLEVNRYQDLFVKLLPLFDYALKKNLGIAQVLL